MEISRELALATECCRFAFDPAGAARVQDLSGGVDWPFFLRLARFHRIQGLVWGSLRSADLAVPGLEAEALSADAAQIAADNLRAAVESRALRQSFETGGIPVIFVKGLTLSALAYGDSTIKSAVDIDMLIDGRHLGHAAKILRQRGYRPIIPPEPATPARLREWHGRAKESVWKAGDSRVVDLHTRLADHPKLIPDLSVRSPTQEVEIAGGIGLPTLRFEELFAYLCVHGASSLWFRLKWIADLAALLHGKGAAEIDGLYRTSQRVGAGRSAAQALLLADTLFGTLRGAPALREELDGDRASRWLFRAALRQVAGRREPLEPTARPFGTAMIHLTQLLLLPGLGFMASEMFRQARAALR